MKRFWIMIAVGALLAMVLYGCGSSVADTGTVEDISALTKAQVDAGDAQQQWRC